MQLNRETMLTEEFIQSLEYKRQAVANESLRQLVIARKEKERNAAEVMRQNTLLAKEKSAEDHMIDSQITKDIRLLIEELPDEQMEVVKMRYFRQMSFKDIADNTGVSINTSLGRMRYALINLRKLVSDNNLILSNS